MNKFFTFRINQSNLLVIVSHHITAAGANPPMVRWITHGQIDTYGDIQIAGHEHRRVVTFRHVLLAGEAFRLANAHMPRHMGAGRGLDVQDCSIGPVVDGKMAVEQREVLLLSGGYW